MDNKLTPSKILRLMNLAESKTPQNNNKVINKRDLLVAAYSQSDSGSTENQAPDSIISIDDQDSKLLTQSSGILDLDRCEEMNETEVTDTAVSKVYNTTHSKMENSTNVAVVQNMNRLTLDSQIDKLTARLKEQSASVANIVRESIAQDSFKPITSVDMSLAERSFIREHADIPLSQSQLNMNLTKNTERKWTECSIRSDSTSNQSIGNYFKSGTVGTIEQVLGRSDSPQYDFTQHGHPLLEDSNPLNSYNTGDSRNYGTQPGFITINDSIDSQNVTLDCIPVKDTTGKQQQHKQNNIQTPFNTKQDDVGVASALNHQHMLRLGVPTSCSTNTNESSLVDSSLSLSLLAKCLSKMDGEVTPSTLFAEAKRNRKKDHWPVPQNKKPVTCYIPNNRDTYNIKLNDTIENKKLTDEKHNADNLHKTSALVDKKSSNRDSQVALLKNVGKTETASSCATIETVISATRINRRFSDEENNDPNICINNTSKFEEKNEESFTPHANSTVSDMDKLNSVSKCTMSTPSSVVVDATSNNIVLSPEYRQLDDSINWGDLMRPNQDEWVKIDANKITLCVGVSKTVELTLTSLTDKWITTRLVYNGTTINDEYNIETIKTPVLLRPNTNIKQTLTITSNAPFNTTIPITVLSQDTCSDVELIQAYQIQALSDYPKIDLVTSDNKDTIEFPPAQVGREVVKVICLRGYSDTDMLLGLEVTEPFLIHSVEMLNECSTDVEDELRRGKRLVRVGPGSGSESVGSIRSRGVLVPGGALRVKLVCNTPSIEEEDCKCLTGKLHVKMLNGNIPICYYNMCVVIGTVNLQFVQEDTTKLNQMMPGKQYKLEVINRGTVSSQWRAIILESIKGSTSQMFKVTPNKLTLEPQQVDTLKLLYNGPAHAMHKGVLILKNIFDGKDLYWELFGGNEPIKTFPIRSTHSELCWTKHNQFRELKLKNIYDRFINVKCMIKGDGFYMECDARSDRYETVFGLNTNECKTLKIGFTPKTRGGHFGKLLFCLLNEPSITKSVNLNGICERVTTAWHGSVARSPSGTALLTLCPTISRAVVCNKSDTPVFISLHLHCNWQYKFLGESLTVKPERAVIAAGDRVEIKVELTRRVKYDTIEHNNINVLHLATLSALTGSLATKSRLLRISEREKDINITNQLSRLNGKFDGEEQYSIPGVDMFNETKRSLDSLMCELNELTAHITLARDGHDTTSMTVGNETTLGFHTMYDDNTIAH